jgi:hypothetical protein
VTPTFDRTPPADLGAARPDAHQAAQLVATAGITLLDADPQFHFSSTTFDPATERLVGALLPTDVHTSLHLPSLTLAVGNVSRSLREGPMADHAAWLAAQLGAELVWPTWDLPTGPTLDYAGFTASDEQLAALTRWFAASHAALDRFVPGVGDASDIRVWPHHFDIARLVTLADDAADPEASRTVGIGMTPGDGGIAEPYLYVTPWPYPETRSTPALPAGRWNTEGWYGAVLEASDVPGQAGVDAFLRVAFDHARRSALG